MISNTPTISPSLKTSPVSSAGEAVACAHCQLSVPKGLIQPDAEHQFCCNGCETVYQMIHQHGMDSYYKIKASDESEQQPAKVTSKSYLDFDDSKLLEQYATALPQGHMSIQLHLHGVHCAACVWLIERINRICPGIIDVKLMYHRSLLNLTWDPAQVKLSEIARLLDSLGYPPSPARQNTSDKVYRDANRQMLIRISVAGFAAGNTMLMSIPLYAGMFSGIEAQYETLFRWTSMVFGWLAVLFPGRIFIRGAIAAIRTRVPHLDLPIAVGLMAGIIAGTANTILGRGEIYFDSITILVFLLLLGRWLQDRQQHRATKSLEMLYALTPFSARRVGENDEINEVHVDSLETDDLVEVRAGETIPVDGIVTKGTGNINLAFLTGESRPLDVMQDSEVFAGSVNLASTLQIRVSKTGRDTRIGKIAEQVEQTLSKSAPIVLFADRIAGWFVLTAIIAATLTFLGWTLQGDPHALDHAIALLVVTCPCALGMATPLTLAITLGRAAQNGILIKGGDMLERLTHKGTIYLDKTGTLTEGQMSLQHFTGRKDTHPYILALERHATHPIAVAFVEAIEGNSDFIVSQVEISNIEQTQNGGIQAVVNGHTIRIGSRQFVTQSKNILPAWADEAIGEIIDQAYTPVLVSLDGEITNVAGFGDALRPEAKSVIQQLQNDGWKIELLSGDHQQIVEHAAARVGIKKEHAHGNLMPEDKLKRVESQMKYDNVVMIGDGVNDANALVAASVGIAVQGGAEASLQAADIYLGQPGLNPINKLIQSSKRALKTIKWTLSISLVYNVIALVLAAMGLLNPLVAAVLMPLSSISVLTIAMACPAYRK